MTGMNLVAVVTAALTAFFQSITSCCCWLIQPTRASRRNRNGCESGSMSAA